MFIGRTDAKAEIPILWLPHAKNWLNGKDSDAGRDWGQEEKGWQTRWTWVWVNSESWWWTGRPGVLWFVGLQSWTRLSNWTESVIWLESKFYFFYKKVNAKVKFLRSILKLCLSLQATVQWFGLCIMLNCINITSLWSATRPALITQNHQMAEFPW